MQTDSTRTEAQKQASRSNGAQGQGPTTEEGKARSSQNARKHDFFTKIPLLPNEDQEEFYSMLLAFTNEHQPATPTEAYYVHEMADAAFRLQRVRIHAVDIQSKAAEDMSEAFEKLAEDGKSLHLCLRYEKHFQRQFDNSLKMLFSLRKNAKPAQPAHPAEKSQAEKDYEFQLKVLQRAMFGPPEPGQNPAFDEIFRHAQQYVAEKRKEPGLGL